MLAERSATVVVCSAARFALLFCSGQLLVYVQIKEESCLRQPRGRQRIFYTNATLLGIVLLDNYLAQTAETTHCQHTQAGKA